MGKQNSAGSWNTVHMSRNTSVTVHNVAFLLVQSRNIHGISEFSNDRSCELTRNQIYCE
jgi:hypothetical protein